MKSQVLNIPSADPVNNWNEFCGFILRQVILSDWPLEAREWLVSVEMTLPVVVEYIFTEEDTATKKYLFSSISACFSG